MQLSIISNERTNERNKYVYNTCYLHRYMFTWKNSNIRYLIQFMKVKCDRSQFASIAKRKKMLMLINFIIKKKC